MKLRSLFSKAESKSESAATIIQNHLLGLSDEMFVEFSKLATRAVKLDYPKTEILISLKSENELKVAKHYCKKEPDTIAWIESFSENDVFFDVGANVGIFSLVASSLAGKHIRSFAFEPSFSSYSALCENILLNDLGEKITPFNCAVDEDNSVKIFNYYSLERGAAKSVFGDPVDWKGSTFRPKKKMLTPGLSVDKAIEFFKLPIPQHIKIDVDGIEQKILKGALNTLRSPVVKSIMLEASGTNEERIFEDFLTEFGFKLRFRQNKTIKVGEFKTRNNFYFKVT